MLNLRYLKSTGLVTLISSSPEQLPIDGYAYITLPERPVYDDTRQHLYVKNGKVVAVDLEIETEE